MRMKELLRDLGFVYVEPGVVQMGTHSPTPCTLEGERRNETPVFCKNVGGFWIAKYCVSNTDYERISPNKVRPPSSQGDNHPVTEVTYLNAKSYAIWLSERHGLPFALPTEEQWVRAAAPFRWQYPYEASAEKPDRSKIVVFDKQRPYGTVPVDDPTDCNHLGLFHMGGNVLQITGPARYTSSGSGFASDGMYCMVRGGDFGHCPLVSSVHTRMMMDVAHRDTRVGFRLVCNIQ